MSEKEMLTKKFIIVGMNDAKISTDDKTIIGTEALVTCIGVLLYCEERKQAIVAHVSSEPGMVIDKIFKLITDNKLYGFPLKYKIIYGTDREPAEYYGVIDVLERYFSDFIPFDEKELSEDGVRTDEKTMSHEFAFDASTGEFVTDKVLFGTDYYIINNEEYIDGLNDIKHR